MDMFLRHRLYCKDLETLGSVGGLLLKVKGKYGDKYYYKAEVIIY